MQLKKVWSIGAGLALLGSLTVGSALAADPPAADQSPVGGNHAHPHHVHLGNGSCVNLDAVLFEPAHHGLHQGADASSGPVQGPFHGTCASPHPHLPPAS